MNNIKKFRKKLKLSQSDIAKLLKVNQSTVANWESEIRYPKIRQAIKLAEILETTVESLYK